MFFLLVEIWFGKMRRDLLAFNLSCFFFLEAIYVA